jgi:glycerol-3-phosphate O-acyltransferase
MCFIALNGEVLIVNKTDMINDEVNKDVVLVTASPVISCEEFREKAKGTAKEDEDKKQVVADAIMNELEKMHIAAEAERQKIIKANQ